MTRRRCLRNFGNSSKKNDWSRDDKPFDLRKRVAIIASRNPMAKLVLLSEGLTGRSHELKVEKTTVGRVDDNTFPISEASVSSHHCEIILRGNDVVIKDLNSTNGTFIEGNQITEAVLKPGQILRVGKIEMRLESGVQPPATKKQVDQTLVIPRGVTLNELEQGSRGFDTTSKGFSKKENKVNKWFIVAGIAFALVIVVLFIYILTIVKQSPQGR